MDEASRDGRGLLGPDAAPEQLGLEIENIVPNRSYETQRVVGLGGSAGSIPALQQFFQAMPPDSGMVFVVILHLSPEHESMLSEVLQRSTSMPVTQAESGEKIQRNHVYVIPPGKQLSLVDSHLRLAELERPPARRMTVDLFFRSLAETHGPSAVAIVLSGGDGDGAIGIKRIKERGGLTIAQDPDTAEHPGMPRSAIETCMVDWVLRAPQIPGRLLEYQTREQRLQLPSELGPEPASTKAAPVGDQEAALREVLSFVRARTARDFNYYKRATIVRRVARRMQVNEVDTLSGYLHFLRTHPGEAGALLKDLLISVTNFFRDAQAFEALEQLIPELFAGKTASDTLRVWVPACATGEEAYSIAILLSEYAKTLNAPPALQIFATDLDEDALAEARNGWYPEAISTDVSPERLQRYFVKEHQGYRIRRELREVLLFAVHDLLKDSPFSRLDLISCRNLLIYLNRDAQRLALETFHFALRPGGRLFLGTSEAIDDDSHLFTPVDKKQRIYASRPTARPSLPVPSGSGTLARVIAANERADHVATLAMHAPDAGAKVPFVFRPPNTISWGELHLKLLERLGPPSVLVNADHDIVHLSIGASRFFQFSGGEPSMNLLRAIHPALRVELRAALFRARQSGEMADALAIPLEVGGSRRLIDIQILPAGELAPDFLLITFTVHEGEVLAVPASGQPVDPLIVHLERELEYTKTELRDVVEQHEASTEELKASNEELQAMNEELRSATEELETSREELQSINEELTTVNQELKSKVDELGHTNSDLHNLMGASAIATVFLDRDLRIMRFTPHAVELFSLINTDVGRPLADLSHKLVYPELLDDCARVLQQLVPIEREVVDSQGRHFLARLLPYRTVDDRIAGVVLTFVDVTDRATAQAALANAQKSFEIRVQERTAHLDLANTQLRNEVIKHLQAAEARRALQRLLVNVQEEERTRISRELHDEVGQQLSSLMFSLKALESAADDGMQTKLRELRDTAEHVGREIHQLAAELRPAALDELGLPRSLSGYLDAWSARTGVNVDFVSIGLDDVRLAPAIETTLYRIVQEAMNNVQKHAGAKTVSVSIERRRDDVVGIVEDDGAGFDAEALNPNDQRRIGVAGMRERANILGGELAIESSPGRGTTVRVRLPLPS